jgi:hypothetical protein
MSTHRRPAALPLLALALLAASPGAARPQPPAVAPNPQAPVLSPVAPLGIQRGSALDLTLTGSNLAEPTGLWTTFPAKVTIPAANNNGKDNAKLLVHLEVPKDAPLGFHALRLATTRGMSNLRLFCVDDLPQVMEVDTNRTRAAAQPVPVPCVVVGRADAEASDFFKVTAAAGQRISFEILGRRLGSAFDPQLTVSDARSGRELAGGYSNDAPGLQTDARLTITFKEAGDYVVEVRDVSYRGGPDFFYRLRIGDFPCATTPLPLAVKRGTKAAVQFAGPTVDGVAPVEVVVPADPSVTALSVAPRGANGLYGWPVSLELSDLDETLEQEPNNEPARANRIPVPGAVTGRFAEKGDLDYYVFAARKGARYVIEAQTHELGSPSEVYAVLRDARGAQLQATNPMTPPRLDYTAPADGDLTLAVEHLHYWGGPDETYRLTVTPYEPGFDLTAGLDRFDVFPGGTVVVPVTATRRDYAGPIEVSVAGPGLSGTATLAAGQTAAQLPVLAAGDLPPGPREFKIVGRATVNGKPVTEFASVRATLSKELAGLPVPPRTLYHSLGLAVTEKPPFTVAAKLDAPPAEPGKPAALSVTVARAPGFTAEVALTAAGLPPNVAPALKNVPANANEVKAQLNLAPNAAVGPFAFVVNGKANHNGKDFSVNSPPVPLPVEVKPPFTLAARLDAPAAAPGKPLNLVVTATRLPGFTGEIALSVAGLPPKVAAAAKNIPANANEVPIALTPAADAPEAQSAVTVTGKAKHENRDFTVNAAPVPLAVKK